MRFSNHRLALCDFEVSYSFLLSAYPRVSSSIHNSATVLSPHCDPSENMFHLNAPQSSSDLIHWTLSTRLMQYFLGRLPNICLGSFNDRDEWPLRDEWPVHLMRSSPHSPSRAFPLPLHLNLMRLSLMCMCPIHSWRLRNENEIGKKGGREWQVSGFCAR